TSFDMSVRVDVEEGERQQTGFSQSKTYQFNHTSIPEFNTAPTASGPSLSGMEDQSVSFSPSNFGYHDVESDALDHITITQLPDPAEGELLLDGQPISANQDISEADIAKLVFKPAANFHGDAHFDYTVSDGAANSAPAQATVAIGSVVDAATVSTSSAPSGNEDTAIALNLDVTEHGDTLDHITLTGFPAGSTFSAGHSDSSGGWVVDKADISGLTVTPPLNHDTDMTLHVVATTTDGTTSLDSVSTDVTVNVTPVDDRSTATPGTMQVDEDHDYQFSATDFGFADPDTGDQLEHVTITSLPDATTQGQFLLNGVAVAANQPISTADIAHLQFKPVANFNGDVDFKYTVSDGHHDSAEATGTLQVASVNDLPTVVATTSTTSEDTDITLTKAQLLAGATDVDHDTLDINSVVVNGGHGTVTDNGDGTWTLHPDANYKGNITLDYKVNDGTADVDNHMTVGVSSVTDAANIALTTSVEQQIINTGTAGRIQVDTIHGVGGITEFTFETTVIGKAVADTGASTGPVAINMGHGSADNMLSLWNPGNMKIGGAGDVATGVNLGDGNNHRLTLTWDSASGDLKVFDNGKLVTTAPNFHKGESMPADLYMVLGQKANGGIASPSWHSGEHYEGSIFNAAMANHALTDAEIAKGPLASLVTKNSGLLFDVRSVGSHIQDTTGMHTLSENGVHHESQMIDTALSVPPPGALLHITPQVTAVDPDDKVVATAIQGLIKDTVLSDGTHTYTITGILDKVDLKDWDLSKLTAQLPAGVVHNMNIGVTATTQDPDGVQEVHTEFNGVKLDPTRPIPNAIIAGEDNKATDEDSAVSGVLTITDEASQQSFVATTYHGAHGDLVMQADGHWTYTPDASMNNMAAGDTNTDIITVESKDGTYHEITLQINGTNDAPTITVQTLSGTEDQSVSLTAANFGFTDVDTGDTLDHITITQLPDPAEGALMLDGHAVSANQQIDAADLSKLVFTPAANYNGDVHFGYTVSDGTADSSPATATINLSAVNDAATAAGNTQASVIEEQLTRGFLDSGWNNLDIVDLDSSAEAKVVKVEINGVEHVMPNNFALDLKGTHGSFHFTQGTDGHDKWSYRADNAQSEIQGLKDGQQLTDQAFLITADGTRIPLSATIKGQDDHVVIDTPDKLHANLGVVTEDAKSTISGTLQAHDADTDDHVTFKPQTVQDAYGTFSVKADGTWTYTLDHAKADSLAAGYRVVHPFSIEAISSDGSTARQQIGIIVEGSNDAPTVQTVALTGTEDTARTFSAGDFGFKDVDVSDTLDHVTITQLPDPAQGVLMLDGHAVVANQDIAAGEIGKLVFTPALNYNGDVHFGYTVSDGNTDSAPAQATISVASVVDTPTVTTADVTGDED
ncbi:tandem-95 repeat protein, partial [Umboniibacter marinipuniceus]|uniref:tandem-95 repeat protein n=1 Tax=Umboniibacter marinipuniceus TaxID=569599 RepID=UPI000EF8E235